MAPRPVFLLAFASLLFFSLLSAHILSAAVSGDVDDDEDLSFLEEPEIEAVSDHNYSKAELSDNEGDEFENYDDFDPSGFDQGKGEDEVVDFDEKDVFVLTDGNFTDFVEDNKYVMVEFYAPWCGHCKAMAPEYAAAATKLKAVDVKLAKVDATLENELAEKYEVQGFPTVYLFVDGEHKPYSGQRSKEAIVNWIKKKQDLVYPI